MDASDRVQLRQQLLAGENSVNTLSGFAANGKLQFAENTFHQNFPRQQMNQGGHMPMHAYQDPLQMSNHDLITPVLESAQQNSSRKASMNSMSMQRFFRRKGPDGGAFDEENGADIGDFTRDMSFKDIAHLRGSGRYNISASTSMDTAPIIPVLGFTGAGGAGPKNLNNVQYRKYMNQQKKLNLAQGARAMSLAGGGNPMGGQDPRSMSFTNNPNNRAMSLGNPLNNQSANNNRAMSLNSNGMMGPGGPMNGMPNRPRIPMNGPPMGNMYPQYSPYQGQMNHNPHMNPNQMAHNPQMTHMNPQMGQQMGPQMYQTGMNGPQQYPNGGYPPHTMSMRSGNPYFQRVPPQGPRANSLTTGPPNAFQENNPPSPGIGQQNFAQNASQVKSQSNVQNSQASFAGSQPQNASGTAQVSESTASGQRASNFGVGASSDSLMNVMEEEEEEDSQSNIKKPAIGASANTSLPLSDSSDDEDRVYTFDDEDDASTQISRKSTIKKSNSMRVRKLDLFKRKPPSSPDLLESLDPGSETPDLSHASVMGTVNKSKELPEIPDGTFHGDSIPEHHLLLKSTSDVDTSHLIDVYSNPAESLVPQFSQTLTNVDSNGSDSRPAKRLIKLRSLTQNTAFSKLRNSSMTSQTTAALGNTLIDQLPDTRHLLDNEKDICEENGMQTSGARRKSPENRGPDPNYRAGSETQSNSSYYSNGIVKQVDTSATQESLVLPDQPKIPTNSQTQGDKLTHTFEFSSTERMSVPQRPGASFTSDVTPGGSAENLERMNSALSTRQASLSRSNSELKSQGLVPSSTLLRGETISEVPAAAPIVDMDKKDKRKSSTSLSSKSRTFIKRLSKSGSRRSIADELNDHEGDRSRVVSSALAKSIKPFHLTKDELAIMNCNNDLQNELQLVTNELALSIKRELTLEAQMRSRFGNSSPSLSKSTASDSDTLDKLKIIADLQDKLNKERRLRFISEEHAILAEHGQSPSALKLDYEKNELYKQLLSKNDLVIQLQDKLEEAEARDVTEYDNDMMHKFNDVLKENLDLKARLKQLEMEATKQSEETAAHSKDVEGEKSVHEYDQALIMSLRTQRDELREMITKLSASQNVELKVAQERIKTLEAKVEKTNQINDKLSRRLEKSNTSNGARFGSGQGGKLQGFSIVSSSNKLFDD